MRPIKHLPVLEVESSFILAVSYDPVERVLYVYLSVGPPRAYRKVPPEVYQSFVDSPSKGTYYNQVIKRFHPYYPVPQSA